MANPQPIPCLALIAEHFAAGDRMNQQRRDGSEARSDKGSKDCPLRVLVGEPWPDGIDVQTQEPAPTKTALVLGVSVFFAVLLTIFAVYGMATANQQMLTDVFRLVQYGTIATVSYALGRSPPRFSSA